MIQTDRMFEAFNKFDIDHEPGRRSRDTFRVKVMMFLVESGVIGIRAADDLHHSNDRRRLRVTVIEENEITHSDIITQRIPSLVIANAIPARGFVTLKVGDRIRRRL